MAELHKQNNRITSGRATQKHGPQTNAGQQKQQENANLLNKKAELPEAMVSKRLLASCSLVLLDLGRPTAAHCDCSSTYTEHPQLLSWMWPMDVNHMPDLFLLKSKPVSTYVLFCTCN